MKRKLRKRRFHHLSGLLIGSLFMPAVSDAAAKPALTSMKEQAAAGKGKISKLLSNSSKRRSSHILIKLKDQVDTPKWPNRRKEREEKSLSAAKQNIKTLGCCFRFKSQSG
ncbi:hypothetical protein PO124_01540 [Bacillus licheniformis]|nr:hypothetical protein [Bacillus licheniformis]